MILFEFKLSFLDVAELKDTCAVKLIDLLLIPYSVELLGLYEVMLMVPFETELLAPYVVELRDICAAELLITDLSKVMVFSKLLILCLVKLLPLLSIV